MIAGFRRIGPCTYTADRILNFKLVICAQSIFFNPT
ncbi:hypothetical protein BCEP4_830030 [Burkholderia cepacia]|nr:hypothetical protein BCEP4_830030 [Burkholderia cepacia]